MPAENPSVADSSNRPKQEKKYFSVAEANRALPYLARIVDQIVACYQQTVTSRERIDQPYPHEDVNQLREEYEQSIEQLNSLIDELHQVGVELKDFELGLVDFPARHQDREIFLCWKRGEEQVAYWHETDTGYSERQDVSVLGSE